MTPYCLRIKNKAVLRTALLLTLISTSLYSCKKANDEIGVDFLPKGNLYGSLVTDSFNIVAYTIPEDSLKIDSLTSNLLGAMNDASFGKSAASLYTQVLLREINVDFGTNPAIDSVILSLARDLDVPTYGSSDAVIDINLHRMDEIIEKENRYYSNYVPAIGNQIGTWSGKISSADTSWFKEDGSLKYKTNTLRIPLNNSFGEDFFTNGQFGSNEVFLNYLNGIALIPDANGLSSDNGAMVGIDKYSDDSKLIIYYNNGLRKEFEINAESQNISTYQLSETNNAIQSQFDNTGTHYTETYVQSMGGCKTRIEIPNLYDLVKDGNAIVINEAKLTFTAQDNSITSDFSAPSRLLLLQPSAEDSSNAFITDLIDVLFPRTDNWIGNASYGGSFDDATKTYTFGINRHVQSLLDTYLNTGDDKNRGFYLIIPSDNPMTPSRLILNTDNTGQNKNIKLKVTYTKL
jgi:hypothetical protein